MTNEQEQKRQNSPKDKFNLTVQFPQGKETSSKFKKKRKGNLKPLTMRPAKALRR